VSITNWSGVLETPITSGRDHVVGPIDAPVSLLEYGDFECPFCGLAHTVVEAVRRKMADKLLFAYRHFPITTAHEHAWKAAEASEAAASQNKFWPYHHMLFEDQANLTIADLIIRAQALDLDIDRFEYELAHGVHAGRVQEDLLGGVRSGVQGTPTFFVDSVRYDGPPTYDALLETLQTALARGS
jgi:protein-disulfide isomerase